MLSRLRRFVKLRVPWLASWLSSAFPMLRGQYRVFAQDPESVLETWSARRVNKLQRGLVNASSYLEVGVQYGVTLEGVKFPERVGVDPFPMFDLKALPRGVTVHSKTSDNYFADLDIDKHFDVIFLDGLHEWFQTYKDIINSLNRLSSGGVVLIDDVIPCDEVSAIPSLEESYRIRLETSSPDRRWHGDVYKALFAMHNHHANAVIFRVIIDLEGNSQAVMWRRDTVPEKSVTLIAGHDAYDQLTYDSAFPDGLTPSFFGCGSEDEVLEEAVAASHRSTRHRTEAP